VADAVIEACRCIEKYSIFYNSALLNTTPRSDCMEERQAKRA
jgi:hypothetical protein